MSYHHILVAVDFDKDNQKVVKKAVDMAKPLQAKLSLVHVNQVIGEVGFTGLMDMDLGGFAATRPSVNDLQIQLDELVKGIDYPIEKTFIVNGDISNGIKQPVKETDIDLIVCGHHHNFWSRISPSLGSLVNTSPVDLLVVALEE
jgi:universal stress protein A